MIDPKLLAILCCPETRQPLSVAGGDLAERLNSQIAAKTLKNAAGDLVKEPTDEYLVTQDGSRAYQVRSGIPVLLADEAISLA